jgi:hypothetical protein
VFMSAAFASAISVSCVSFSFLANLCLVWFAGTFIYF